jgi:gliding motility-associated-like protein
MFKYLTYFIFLILFAQISLSQDRNSVWVFGDSALIDFSDINNPVTGVSAIRSRGSCASIADKNGDLLFYAQTFNPAFQQGLNNLTRVFNRNHEVMMNGDSIIGQAWQFELLIINNPVNNNEYFLFSVSVTNSTPYGVYYSIIDMSKNNGLGEVISKNNQIANWQAIDCISAVKNANGKDWWIITRRWDFPNNIFYTWLINENGIQGPFTQQLGLDTWSGFNKFVFSPQGTKMAMLHYLGNFQLFDFDRCTGLISNPVTIDVDNENNPAKYWSAEFSGSGRYLYLASLPDNNDPSDFNYLFQYDLEAPDIPASKFTVTSFQLSNPFTQHFGTLKRAPDNKIYLATAYFYGYALPYHDSVYNYINMNLSVINEPDAPGAACNFTPFSFYLGGKRTYWGLPNNPDYELGPDVAQPANAGNDTAICTDGSVKLGIPANNVSTYLWYPPDALDNANIAQPTATPIQDTWYYLTVTDTTKSAGCNETRDSVFVKVINCDTIDTNNEIIIPNIITPNKDDKNDYFFIKNLPSNSSLTIFNRWGNEIYKTDDYKNDWPINEISAGVYFYVLKITGEEEVRKGMVTVVK